MTICGSRSLLKMTTMLVSVGVLGGLSACATTSISKIEEAAPVSYRIGEGSSSYAAVRIPQQVQNPVMGPELTPSPSPLAVPRPSPQPQIQQQAQQQVSAPKIDLSNIDRGLYDHMKVGKSYKVAGQTYNPQHNPDYDKIGVASWYGDKFHGKPTANGEIYNKNELTAAHKTLPLNSYVYVTNLDNGQSIKVRLNDRGPFIDGRIIDLSEAAASVLDITQKGTGRVRVQYAGAAMEGVGTPYQPAPTQHSQRVEPQPAPVLAPLPQPMPKPAPVAETPAPQSVPYAPLRNGGSTTPVPQQVAQQPSPVFEVPNIMGGSSGSFGIALPERSAGAYQQQVPIPQPISEGVDEDVVTLTIKGPVHMAKSNNNNQGQPEVIPAVYEEEK